jgi:hypothetical protein
VQAGRWRGRCRRVRLSDKRVYLPGDVGCPGGLAMPVVDHRWAGPCVGQLVRFAYHLPFSRDGNVLPMSKGAWRQVAK